MATTSGAPAKVPPLTDAIAVAVSRLVDDRDGARQPSHWDVGQAIERSGLAPADPGKGSAPVGKYKRLHTVLLWAVENDLHAGQRLVGSIVGTIRGSGGFRPDSANFVTKDALANAQATFKAEGWLLCDDGELRRHLLDDDELGTQTASEALSIYVRRANHGAEDAALVTGTGKDLVEATAAHVLVQRFGSYSPSPAFAKTLYDAYLALGLTSEGATTAQGRVEQGLFNLACAINGLRNKQGTGHGRPFPPEVSDVQARVAIRAMGTVADLLLSQEPIGQSS